MKPSEGAVLLPEEELIVAAQGDGAEAVGARVLLQAAERLRKAGFEVCFVLRALEAAEGQLKVEMVDVYCRERR